jgi:translation initiation factor IF-1
MNKTNTVLLGTIREILPNTMFRIDLSDGRVVLATPSGKMRRSFFKLMPGNQVKVEMTPYDDKRGRVIAQIN